MLFPLGKIVATPGAIQLPYRTIHSLLGRHANGDYGTTGADENDPERGDRVMSSYDVGATSYFIITEADRSSTCVMKVEEY